MSPLSLRHIRRTPPLLSARCLGWLALGLGLVGCRGEPDRPLRPFDDDAGEPDRPLESDAGEVDRSLRQLEVGAGRKFTPIKEGGTLELYFGGQGSQHVFVSLRVWELTNVNAEVKLSLERVSDGARLSVPYSVNLRFDRGTQEGEPAKLEGLLLVINELSGTLGREVRLNASFESDDGEHGTDSRTGTLDWAQNQYP
ncbi:hypothetical protein JY651_40245 [Pyxidicoccus parkwayensis]|uniref:Lipoprotein n=1 Tax=Pyxidicoccus parkwayensis TaxID=2813578 RepID=A0ABX7NR59_9BACT|nr:hypothetical protein [Pyxidicoccus parkwaysis]QSQ21356.1 hypothetical protein JY651_40245 [Pyxidicoccus parkwaysis]